MQWYFNRATHLLSHTDRPWYCEARGDTIPGIEPMAAGTYTLGAPEYNEPTETEDLTSMGCYFIPIYGDVGHSGEGIHGGGTGLPHPLAAQQGWKPTLKCIRVQNIDLLHLALNVGEGDTLTIL